VDIPGLPASFAQQFQDGVHLAMTFGEPPNDEDKPKFLFAATKVYPPGTALDQEGRPLDPTVEPTTTAPDPVTVPCAVEFSTATAEELPIGNFRPTKATITLLDVDFALVKDATDVVLGGDTYLIGFKPPPIGAGPVTVFQFICFARQET
jgi:hypothetical protein